MTIDTTTGLPALPEGYFWEVAPHMEEVRAGNRYGGYSDPWEVQRGYEVRIMALCIETKQREKRWPWSKPEIEVTETSAVETRRQLIDPKKVAAATAERKLVMNVAGGSLNYTRDVHYEHITPEIVREAAIVLLGSWYASREAAAEAKKKRAASEALVGAYPPKVLA